MPRPAPRGFRRMSPAPYYPPPPGRFRAPGGFQRGGWWPRGGQQQPKQQELVQPGDIFQGQGTAGYTEEGTSAPVKADATAMDKAAAATGDGPLGVPMWAWIGGGIAAAAAAYFAFGKRA